MDGEVRANETGAAGDEEVHGLIRTEWPGSEVSVHAPTDACGSACRGVEDESKLSQGDRPPVQLRKGPAMRNDPELSVIIPCHHSDDGLMWQLEALLHQRSAPPREILLCDNGGNDDLEERLRELGPTGDDVTVRLIDAREHPGAAYARNRGIGESLAPLLAFCDDDDLVHPNWCRRAVAMLTEHPVVSGGIVVMDDVEFAALGPAGRKEALEARTEESPARPAGRGSIGPALMGGNFAAHRDALLKVGGFDAALVRGGEDNDLAYRLQHAGIPIVDAGGMSIIYARPSDARHRVRVRRQAGRSLAEVAAARDAWGEAPEFRHPPLIELVKSAGALARMATGAKQRDWLGGVDRVATAWGLSEGWLRHRVRRVPVRSEVGVGLE